MGKLSAMALGAVALSSAYTFNVAANDESTDSIVPLPPTTARIVFGETAAALDGYTESCRTYPRECVRDAWYRRPATVKLTPRLWDDLNAIQRDVNTTIKYRSDNAKYPKSASWPHESVDVWTFAEDGEGDCEDFARLKIRRWVRELKIPESAALILVVDIPITDNERKNLNGEELKNRRQLHALPALLTDRGVIIFEDPSSLAEYHHAGVPLAQMTSYKINRIQSPTHRNVWKRATLQSITPPAPGLVASARNTLTH